MTMQPANEIRAALASAIGPGVDPARVRIPSRRADASLHLPGEYSHTAFLPEAFGALYGAPLVASLERENGWLLFIFSNSFFDALVDQTLCAFPAPRHDGGELAVNRMLALARHGGAGCPDLPGARRALLLAAAASDGSASLSRARHAALTLFHSVPPRDRPALFLQSGPLGGALARLLARSGGGPTPTKERSPSL